MIQLTQEDLARLLSGGARKAHLIGVAGSGMSGLARLLVQRGHSVTGSDLTGGPDPEPLRHPRIRRFRGHAVDHVGDPDFVCYSSAIANDNPELLEAERRGIPIVRRARALAAIIPPQKPIVVSGTHGKTTTSSMIAHILTVAGMHPSFFVGSSVPVLGTNAAIGTGDLFTVEADESDGSMNEFRPEDLIILNIEAEHLDFYPNLEAIERAFEEVARVTSGKVIYCGDDAGARRVGKKMKHAVSYGLSDRCSWRAERIAYRENQTEFDLFHEDIHHGRVVLTIPGRHNVSNAVAALAATLLRGVGFVSAAKALEGFQGANRRFQRLYDGNEFVVVDDYAHHPSEVKATIEAARQTARKRVVAVFQPHRYSRTKALHKEFSRAFDGADRVFITDVYAASETPIAGVDGNLIAAHIPETQGAIVSRVVYEPDLWRLKEYVGSEVKPGDLVLVMGAGNIYQLGRQLAAELKVYEELKKLVSEKTVLRRYESMAKRTSMRVGGFAKLWVEPASEEDLAAILKYCAASGTEEDPVLARVRHVTFVGRGSNLLVRDTGISGVTIHLGAFHQMEARGDRLHVGAGVRLKQIAMQAKKDGIAGFEFMEGIPGSLGGALWMNAGAMGNAIFDVVEKVRLMDLKGNIVEKKPSDLDVRYRSCKGLVGKVALSAVLKGHPGKGDEIAMKLKSFEQKRWKSQPAAPSAGCIFKNPETIPAGKLIDELGLKGLNFGKARVSEVHGNFIVNDGGATASDVLHLITLVKDRVRKERGIELETEVIVIGDERW